MRAAPALKVALDLMHVPSRVRLVRSDSLPDGIVMLLQIAAGDQEATRLAADMTDRSGDVLQAAASFFIEQILLGPDTDSYRRLGASPEASPSDLRRNMALLLRWLHPHLDRQGDRSPFVRRVTGAWNDVKTPERRAAYDEARRTSSKESLPPRTKAPRSRPRTRAPHNRLNNVPSERRRKSDRSIDLYNGERGGLLRRVLLLLFGGVRR